MRTIIKIGHIGSWQTTPKPAGAYSLAIGNFNDALGSRATAVGAFNTAKGEWATAIGASTVASGNGDVAIGDTSKTNATGVGHAVAVGWHAETGAANAVAVGPSALASGKNSVSVGTIITLVCKTQLPWVKTMMRKQWAVSPLVKTTWWTPQMVILTILKQEMKILKSPSVVITQPLI